MRLEVKYKLFDSVGEKLVGQDGYSYTIIDIDTRYNTDIHELIKVEISEITGNPSVEFKILGYTEL
ncbi:hypothetical protein FH966_02675 [Lentibacillus cibarius]|uniref:Uncharacterized protein n=1 Tax=Lentibacillus cibarius TaxID=2583219 RepID=A0A549YFQ0_9BACI|nr:hypothetical protein [Lentibacillus cibarius]TRM10706.1 hypothetical protein FH966_02675 [Lentibacillus cibarius]